jgi:adenylosuccinate synthase
LLIKLPGQLVDLLASEGVDVVARCAGGNIVGHTVVVGETHFAFHLLPSGVILPDCIALLGNGVVIHLPDLLKEMKENEEKGLEKLTPVRLKISDRAHLMFDLYRDVDRLLEEKRLAVDSSSSSGKWR